MKFWDLFKSKSGAVEKRAITVQELMNATADFQLREAAFWTCVDLIANAVGRCDFRTFLRREEVWRDEWYLWNVEPNANQSSSAFLHELIARLCTDNEALIVPGRVRNGAATLLVAEGWNTTRASADAMVRYHDVKANGFSFARGFNENEVLHLRLNHLDLKPVIDGLYGSYVRMIDAAVSAYERDRGPHWKVHVDAVMENREGFKEAFQEMLSTQVKTYLNSKGGVLPEFDGYLFENMDKGGRSSGDTADVRELTEEVFSFTARAFMIPSVLVNGKVEGTKDANERFLTYCVDPILDQLTEEINRKRYGREQLQEGSRMFIDSSSIMHLDVFAQAGNIEKLVGSGVMSINDICRTMGLPPIGEAWADEHYMTLNIGRASEQTRAMEN